MRVMRALILFLLLQSYSIAHAHQAHMLEAADPIYVSVAMDKAGALWRVSVKDGFVWLDQSSDLGQHFSKAIRVNPAPQSIALTGEGRPQVAIGKTGNIYVSWGQNLKTLYASNIWFARSVNNGKSVEAPYIVHQDRSDIAHAFNTLDVDANDKITVLWLDQRDAAKAKAAGKPYDGLALYYAVSTNAGQSFTPEVKLADATCQCCRLATAIKPDGTVAVMWRHIFAGSERDHALTEIHPDKPANIVRASFGHWKIDGCPHQGPALAVGAGFGYHMAYFDGAGDQPGLRYARMDSDAWVTSPPKKFGNRKNHAEHPSLASVGDTVWLAWRESNANKGHTIYAMHSTDGGRNWSDAASVLASDHKTDYPQLLTHENTVYLVVNTQTEGLKVIKMLASN